MRKEGMTVPRETRCRRPTGGGRGEVANENMTWG